METQREFLIERARKFIKEKHTILYLDFTVTSDSGLLEAAEFLADEFLAFSSFVEHGNFLPTEAPPKQICVACFKDREVITFNINGRCDVCGGTDWIMAYA